MTATSLCPVCRRADAGGSHCARCGWQMSGPLLLGGGDPETLDASRRDLESAGHRWDAIAATRAARATGDPFDAYADLLRGEGAAVATDLPTSSPGHPADLAPMLARLVSGDLPALHFVEFTAEHAVRVTATADRAGVPAIGSGPVHLPWSSAVLGAAPRVRAFRLAGGVGREPVDAGAFDEVTARSLAGFLPADGETVLVTRHPGWVLLERAAELARRHHAPVAELVDPSRTGTLSELVAAVLRRAPLAYDYVLLGMSVDHDTGQVDLVPLTLFPAGTVTPADRPLSRQVPVYGPPIAAEATTATLPLLARHGAHPADWPILRLPRLELAGRAAETVTVTLVGPGALHCADGRNGDLPVDDPESLRTGLRHRPMTIPVPPSLDLVCLVELCGGSRDEVQDRLDILLRTVDLLTERYARQDSLRIGVVGYFDHVYTEAKGDRQRELCRVVELGEPGFVRAQVARWRPAPRQRDYATAVGDALARANRLRWRRDDPRVEHAVLMIGRRPPEARPGSDDLIPTCPRQVDWQVEMNRLQVLRARRVARVDLPADWPGTDRAGNHARSYAEHAWQVLARDGLHHEDGRPEDLADLVSDRPSIADSKAFPFPFLAPAERGRSR
ncbi:hypothetical protein [Plantactinospora soyae]|uniref:Uncharacterized protein n=1 Tax=Plantactinospora soyae TaxID=1544732 RepID=A0A927M0E2_9ACTN|nr:hypothetical protein [Plantactinospora soyae]MBE1484386.1 hypothetical protein [Plantactinospora soyae]